MTVDHSIDYSYAGKGAKRRQRERLTLEAIPRKTATGKPKPDYRAHRKIAEEEVPIKTMTARSLRHKIIELSLQIGSFGEIVDRMEREQYGPATKVLVSNIRDHTLTVLKVIMAEGLITEKALLRYREDAKEAQRRQFERRREREE